MRRGSLSTVWLPNYGRPFVVWIRGAILHAIWQFRKTIKGGDRTDWYSSFAGDVIPWNSATEFERAAAYSQLESFKLAVQALSEQLLTTDNKDSGGDKRVFASLLKQVVNFPDQDFVYLVDGVLVITFWGFVHDNDEQRDPMHWLKPVSPSLTTPGVVASAPRRRACPCV